MHRLFWWLVGWFRGDLKAEEMRRVVPKRGLYITLKTLRKFQDSCCKNDSSGV